MPNKKTPAARILITQPLQSRSEFFHALGAVRDKSVCRAPHNLDDLADFLREHEVASIVVSQWKLPEPEGEEIAQVFTDAGVRLLR
ncbi:Hypothetical protein NG00_01524 [Corynebacterium camporealensis]|uniref:Uncharacterized protein n=1 Tax=Corynebacterium camporealensis TaxID=161896 RepID=A0A0F6QZ46_9CORY|nr:hypothetical protein [Corynebacterium camporealensis]AKE39633.1 hypothetical protein UL81_08415 [Corynebacterium camporealensis]AVH88764.1 Hypothetical protein NG00_01524 [Corynebacterium camporealensis]MDY5840970.1 hypothetical protein [Corynebacterium camporealensis]